LSISGLVVPAGRGARGFLACVVVTKNVVNAPVTVEFDSSSEDVNEDVKDYDDT